MSATATNFEIERHLESKLTTSKPFEAWLESLPELEVVGRARFACSCPLVGFLLTCFDPNSVIIRADEESITIWRRDSASISTYNHVLLTGTNVVPAKIKTPLWASLFMQAVDYDKYGTFITAQSALISLVYVMGDLDDDGE